MKEVKFALIGCGRIAQWHADAIRQIKDARLVAVCDLVEEKAETIAKKHGVKHYTNYHDMLYKEDINVVNIITPSGMHAEHAIDIMNTYKKHVVVEKPMALRVEDCQAMIETAKKNKVSIHAIFQNRFNKAVLKVKEAMQDGLFGKIVLGTVRIRWCRTQKYYERDPWRGKWSFDGGVLTSQAVHHIDLLRWLLGEPEVVSGIASTRLNDIEVEDTACAWIRFKNGALAAIEATTAARPDDLEASLSILGEQGTVIVEGVSVNKITTWTLGKINMKEFSEAPPTIYGFGHIPFLEGVVKSIRNKNPYPISGEEGEKTIRLLHAIYSSIEQGKHVYLDDEPRSLRLGILKQKDKKIRDLYITPNPYR